MKDKIDFLKTVFPTVSRETIDKLCAYEALVRKWQPHINLIANSTLDELWIRHIVDSVQVFKYAETADSWLDIGSGGGFPGLVTAICLKQKGSGRIALVESNHKKAAFLRTVVAELDLPADIYANRIEDCYQIIAKPQAISARALASLDTLFSLVFPWFDHETIAILQKGRDYLLEIDEARANWQFSLVKHSSQIDRNSVLLEITDLQPIH